MVDLSPNQKVILENIVRQHATDQPYRVVIFGSRATSAKKYSDLDIALMGKEPVPLKTVAMLAEAFENSHLPYMVDIIDFSQASAVLQDQIMRYGVELLRT